VRIWDANTFSEVTVLQNTPVAVPEPPRMPSDSKKKEQTSLRGVNLKNSFLGETDFSDSDMTDVLFGQYPSLQLEDQVECIACSPDGKKLAAGLRNSGDIQLFNNEEDTVRIIVDVLRGHEGGVTSIEFRFDGQQLISGGDDNTVRIWDLENLSAITVLKGHTGIINSVAYRPDGQQIASGSMDGTVRIWDANTFSEVLFCKMLPPLLQDLHDPQDWQLQIQRSRQ